jgi:Integrase core domain
MNTFALAQHIQKDNGAHERMHKDVAVAVEYNPGENTKAEQRAIDKFRQEFNHVRPHKSLNNKTPAEVYETADTPKHQPKQFFYPATWTTLKVHPNGTLRFPRSDGFYFSTALCGHSVGLEPFVRGAFQVWLGNYSLGNMTPFPDDARLIELSSLALKKRMGVTRNINSKPSKAA